MKFKNISDQITQKNSKYGNILWKDLKRALMCNALLKII